MRIVIGLLLILLSEMLNSGSGSKEHVHFKIHVPEIINHHIHTKTIFIHEYKPEPKKPKAKEEASKTYHKEKHHEDWSSWSNYGHHNDYQDKPSNRDQYKKNQENHKDRKVHENVFYKNPFLKYHRDSYMPVSQHTDKVNDTKAKHRDMTGPAQYEVHEDVKENDQNNIEPYMHAYEEGYHRGIESETGHLYTDDLIKHYDDKLEEVDQSVEKYKNHSKEKTHAGRYFVDDDEYQRSADKYETEKRSITPKIL